MKVLFLTVRSDLGGGPEHLYQLLYNRPADLEAFVACPNDKPYRDRFAALLGEDHMRFVPHRAFSTAALFALARTIRQDRITLLHSHGKGAGLYARLLRLMTGRLVVHTFHGLHTGAYSPARKAIYLWVERVLGLLTWRAICVSQGEAEQIKAAAIIAPRKLVVIENGIEIPAAITRPDWNGGQIRLLAVNRYERQKNPDLLIDIALALRGKLAFQLDVIGTGERFDEIAARVARERLGDCVTLHGGVTDPRSHFRRAHLFLSTSRWEGMPLAVLEAMSEGLCVLATDVVGNADVIETGRNGLLYRTAEEAVAALRGLTPGDWARMAAAARRDAEARYSASVMAQKTFQALSRQSP